MVNVIEGRKEINVYAGQDGHVCITQDDWRSEEMLIILHPNDIPELIDYLKLAQAEANKIRDAIKVAESES